MNITEDDEVRVAIDPITLAVPEGATGSYTVKLTSQPCGDVTITISGHSHTDLTLSGTTLSADDELNFTTSNRSQPQTAAVTAAGDETRPRNRAGKPWLW